MNRFIFWRLCDKIGLFEKQRCTAAHSSPSDRPVNNEPVMAIFEEMFMLNYDCNSGKKVHAECTVEIGKAIRLTSKDDGRILDTYRYRPSRDFPALLYHIKYA